MELPELRVMIAGGGTGGHIIPALAVATELVDRHGAEVLFVGTARGMELRLVPEAGFRLRLIEAGPLKNVSLLRRARTLMGLPRGILECRKLIRGFRPGVVFGVGGYASGPAMAAALSMKVPTMVFEPNAAPGLANRLVGMKVQAAAVNFSAAAKWFRNCEVTGIPVRPDFFQLGGRRPRCAAPAGLWGLAGSADLQHATAPDHRAAAGSGPGTHGAASERGAPRRKGASGLRSERSRSAALAGADVSGRHAGLLCPGAPGDGPQRRFVGGRTGSCGKAQPAGSLRRGRRRSSAAQCRGHGGCRRGGDAAGMGPGTARHAAGNADRSAHLSGDGWPRWRRRRAPRRIRPRPKRSRSGLRHWRWNRLPPRRRRRRIKRRVDELRLRRARRAR